ncbi:MAG: FtsW/RodA/SpoVE family cell cycle protein [Endomicrobia bacterium]|nr:FtsW/RodA/SpoVE family cell cycle protein [Endomicrobiia bacterium]MCX7940198.1 FtsW/RodA/SpoVE family cell cycle protein [Endomicrobiia bacterium]MDW8055884.1 FtsW/RodA/SpoVE family cell cycle protein [Elusimicrobiota bacterium]
MNLSHNKNVDIHIYKNIYFSVCIVLSIIGLIVIYSTTVCKSTPVYNFFLKQIIATIIGLCLCISIARLKHQYFRIITYPLLILTALLLITVLFMPEIKGSRRWIPLPFIGNFQPSELAKFSIVLFTAKFIDKHRSKIVNGKKEFWILVGVVSSFCVLILLQKDIGIPAIIFCVTCTLLFIAGIDIKYLIKLLVIVLPVFIGALVTQPHRVNRIKQFFLDREKSISSYQIKQSIFAISRGKFFGCGLGRGVFKEYYIPEIHTDFIFCTIGEELGFIGSLLIVGAFLSLAYFGSLIAHRLYYTQGGFYGSMLVLGLTLYTVIQAYLNIAVVTKLFLPKGIGLPFVSYGGSSMVVNFITLGTILSVCNTTKK